MKNKDFIFVFTIFVMLGMSSVFVIGHNLDSNEQNKNWMDVMHGKMNQYFANYFVDGKVDHETMHKEMIRYVPEEQRDYHETMHESMIQEYGNESMPSHRGY